jgi:hypothetical protein
MATTVQGAPPKLTLDWGNIGALISAVGALGFAAFGVVEALGKALTITFTLRGPTDGSRMRRALRAVRFGLPYVGFRAVRLMVRPLEPALECAYGSGFLELIAQQYRADRSKGRAPDMIREGVKLGLPFLGVEKAAAVIDQVWKMDPGRALALAQALMAEQASPPGAAAAASRPASPRASKRAASAASVPPAVQEAQLLAGRFATALDERVNAAFMLAEQQYEAYAKMWAAVASVVLALAFNLGLQARLSWLDAFLVGIVAVPLAPVAKDLSTSLQNALTAFKSIPARRA